MDCVCPAYDLPAYAVDAHRVSGLLDLHLLSLDDLDAWHLEAALVARSEVQRALKEQRPQDGQ